MSKNAYTEGPLSILQHNLFQYTGAENEKPLSIKLLGKSSLSIIRTILYLVVLNIFIWRGMFKVKQV